MKALTVGSAMIHTIDAAAVTGSVPAPEDRQ